jgi:hypothetical protein
MTRKPRKVQSHYGTAKIIGDSARRQAADLESSSIFSPMEAGKNPYFTSPVDVTVNSFRTRLADSDGLSAKACIDSLVQCGIIADDSARYVREVRYKQTKVKNKEDEKTVFEIVEVEDGN